MRIIGSNSKFMSDQKRVFIIHGWGATPDSEWLPWLAKNLRERSFSVEVPAMPDTDNPKIEAWVSHLEKIVGRCDENTYFVGGSIGCQAIMRYLEIASSAIRQRGGNQKLSDSEKSTSLVGKCGGIVFVAPWITLTGLESDEERFISSPWITMPIDLEKVKARAKKIICIFSDDDPYVPKENWKIFSEKLGSENIIEKNKGHFSDDDGVKELPIALEAVLRIAKNEK